MVDKRHEILKQFLERWSIKNIENMTLKDYSALDNKDSFCYWIEHIADSLGRIKGSYSSMFGIWQMKVVKSSTSEDFTDDGVYKWYRKYGNTAEEAFDIIKELVLDIVRNSKNKQYANIDGIDYFSLVKWKIAFIYSDYELFPVYKKTALRQIAKNFEYPNYNSGRLSSIHRFLVAQKPDVEDLFEFAFRQYHIAENNHKNNYYIIGSKYRNSENKYYDISSELYERNVISTGFFWDEDLSHLYGYSTPHIHKWLDKNLKQDYPEKYETAKQVVTMFLGIKEGDIIALKSKGQFNKLTIIAYAEVVKLDGNVYHHDDSGKLGHCINVKYLETGLSIEIGLNYAQTLHKIVPKQKLKHFEKIFGNYALVEEYDEEEIESDIDFELSESRINEKQTKSIQRDVSYSVTVRRIHNKIQSAFAKYLQKQFPNDIIQTEYKFIDIVRQNSEELFYYEVKPFNTAYGCIRASLGQLLDYFFSNQHSQKRIHLLVVGSAKVTHSDLKFIEFLKKNLNISFDYISFNNLD